ncbi:MAG: protein tyrosine phosphatase [Bacteroidetes bacterium QH_2_63_10]|nr:MAG: protein tyrosine phosphatase [Bacteroidetes bacterium QH_2_63_10]
MTVQFLFVCTGNTCRSPMAAALAEARGVAAASAGVAAERGDGAAPNAIRALRDARGLSLQDHEPRDVSDVPLADADRIVAMSPAVARRLRDEHDIDPDALITWAISDPYGGSLADYRWCLEQISTALEDLLASG